jgi:hypothetical protein
MRGGRQIEEMNDGKMESVQIVEGQAGVNRSIITAKGPSSHRWVRMQPRRCRSRSQNAFGEVLNMFMLESNLPLWLLASLPHDDRAISWGTGRWIDVNLRNPRSG